VIFKLHTAPCKHPKIEASFNDQETR
jgi:hypothetical protein